MLSFFLKSCGENKSVNFLPANIKSINPIQKYPHIIESYAFILKIFVLILLLLLLLLIDALISLGNK